MVFYESPNRLLKTLKIIKTIRPNVKVAIGRELTKVFEEVITDDIEKVIKHFEINTLKGEIVGMIYRAEDNSGTNTFEEEIKKLKSKGFKAKEISTILSTLYDTNKNTVYKQVLELEEIM